MANYFWVGGTGTFDGVTNHFATTTGGTATVANPTSSDTVTYDSSSGTGTVTFTADMTCSTSACTSANITLAPGTHTITVAGTGTVWDISAGTFTAATSTIVCSGNNATFITRGKTYHNVSMTGTGTAKVQVAGTFLNFTRTGTATTTDALSLLANQTVTGTLTLTGNSTTNRLLTQASPVGTPFTFTAAAVSLTNVDFIDITGAGAASPFTGTSLGDGQGNSGITFDTPATQTWSGNTTGNWSTAANWTSRVPLPQDNVVISGLTSGTITVNMPRIGLSIDYTGSTAGHVTYSANVSIFGSFKYVSTLVVTGNFTFNFLGRSTYNLTCATIGPATSTTFNGPGGTYTLQDNFVMQNATAQVNFTMGTVDASVNNVNVTAGTLFIGAAGKIKMGSGTWSVTSTGNVWTSTAGATITPNTSTIAITNTSVTNKTFIGAAFTYYNLSITGGGSGTLTFTGANTFNSLPQVTGGTESIVWPGSATTTFSNGGNFGNGTNVLTFTASAGSATLSFGSQVSADYLNLTNIPASTTTPAYAGTHSTDGGGNTNWLFTAPPSGTSQSLLMTGVGS